MFREKTKDGSTRLTGGRPSPLDAYPVGAVYTSMVDTSPEELFGGMWTSLKGRVLVGVDPSQTEFSTPGKTGGLKDVTLTVSQMPSHNHGGSTGSETPDAMFSFSGAGSNPTGPAYVYRGAGSGGSVRPIQNSAHSHTIASQGSNQSHENLPPYMACYMWMRSA